MILKEFNDYVEAYHQELQSISEFLARPIPDDPVCIAEDLRWCASHRHRAGVHFGMFLQFQKDCMVDAWPDEGAATQRQVMAEGEIAPIIAMRKIWENNIDCLREKGHNCRKLLSQAASELQQGRDIT